MPKVSMAVPHALGQEAALDRLKTFAEKVRDKFADSVKNMQETWDENGCNFGFRTYGMDFAGTMKVEDSEVKIEGDLPFRAMMFKGRIQKEVETELTKLLA
ncbi:MAG: polyhydroxyalkanoic acid system family protein [Pirellulales bacterium]|nr:polyhydroxyalkanoic acid system family protein [Pirellulales bacterium]